MSLPTAFIARRVLPLLPCLLLAGPALAQTGTISGTITSSNGGTPLQGVQVQFYTSSGILDATRTSGADGSYALTLAQAGTTYYVLTSHDGTHINEIHDSPVNIACGPICSPFAAVNQGTGVVVPSGSTTTIDFSLDPGGSISGTVTQQGSATAIAGVGVTVVDGSGSTLDVAFTSGSGAYTIDQLPTGTYYLMTAEATGDRIDEYWDDVPCVGQCISFQAPTRGTAIAVTAGLATSGRDFALSPAGRISGTVTDDAATPNALAALLVTVFTSSGASIVSGVTDGAGLYNIGGLPAGSYLVATQGSGTRVNEVWDNRACAVVCTTTDLAAGTPIGVVAGQTTTGKDFALAEGGRISGTVTQDGTGTPVAGIAVKAAGSNGIAVGVAMTDGSGAFTLTQLPTGSYKIFTDETAGNLVDEVWNDVKCLGPCVSTFVASNGSTVEVTAPGTTSGRDFALSQAGRIGGTVTDQGTSAPLTLTVNLYTQTGTLIVTTQSNASTGDYGFGGLQPGIEYRLATQVTQSAHIAEVWDDNPCAGFCTVAAIAAGDPVTVTAGLTSDHDFQLVQSGRITGTVTLEGGGPLASAIVIAVNQVGELAATTVTNASGQYTLTGLLTGTYFAATGVVSGAINEVYDNVPCPLTCLPTFMVEQGDGIAVSVGSAVQGIDFALASAGAISGIVTGESGAPLVAAAVAAFTPAGTVVAFGTTDSTGAYTISGLSTGTYRVATSAVNVINEVYNDHPCASFLCSTAELAAGDPVAVASPATTAGVNFSLGKGSAIGGTITGEAGPLLGVLVFAVDSDGFLTGTTTTDAAGLYALSGLDPGTYRVYTFNDLGYFNEVYDNIVCQAACSQELVVTGTPIALDRDETFTANFQLTKGGDISGTIAAEGGGPIAGAEIVVVNSAGEDVSFVLSNSTGGFNSGALSPGTYYLYAAARGHLAEYYDNVPCNGFCFDEEAPVRGTAVVIAGGEAVTGRNFALATASRIAGTVTSASGTPLEDVSVEAYNLSGVLVSDGFTNEDGEYVIDGLPSGIYRIATDAFGNFVNEVWDNVTCLGSCGADELKAGTPIVVAAAETVSSRDFVLESGSSITGVVTDAATGSPLAEIGVFALTAAGDDEFVAFTDETGAYEILGMPAGAYTLLTDSAQNAGYLNEIFDNIACRYVHCTYSETRQSGTPIVLSAGASATASFGLMVGGRITGTITDGATGAPVAGVSVNAVRRVGNDIDQATSFPTDATGSFAVAGLPAGTWWVFTENEAGYFNEIHPDIPCVNFCDERLALAGTPIAVTQGGTSGGVNFALAQGGRIGGRVTDAASGDGVAEVSVTIVDQLGTIVSSGYTNDDGDYTTGAGLPTGTFFAVVDEAYDGLLPEIFDNIPCSTDCLARATTGAPIAVTVGTTTPGKNIALERGGRISGRVTSAAGAAVSDGIVFIYDASGRQVDSTSPSRDGTFISDIGLRAGTYYAHTSDFAGLVSELFHDRPCPTGCEPSTVSSGTPIAVSLGVTTAGVDFALAAAGVPEAPYALAAGPEAGRVLITWEAPLSGGPAVSYLLEAGLVPRATVVTIPVAATRYLIDSVPPGRYYLRVRAVNAAGAGPPSDEIEMTIGAANLVAPDAPEFPVMTMVGRRLIMTWGPPYSGGPVSQYIIEAGTASGLTNLGSLVTTGPVFTYEPVPDGFYFLRVRARNAAGASPPSEEVMLVVGGVPAPPRAPEQPAATVSGSTVSLSWFAPPGAVTGYILEAGSASGLSNLATVSVGPATSISFTGIPPGTYYVRIRAVNALGRSVVSEEVVIVVR